METKKYRMGPATRLEIGAVILEAAQLVDTKLVAPRLKGFTAVHRAYTGAQRKVEAVEAQLREIQAQLARRDADEAVEAVARTLVAEGQPRANPFAALGAGAPSSVKKLIFAEKATAMHQLVAAVQRSKTVSQATRDAAQAAEKAARAIETALAALEMVGASLQKARRRRDAIGESWDSTLAALKRRARSAADEGGSGLYTALFGRLGRAKKKPAAPAPVPAAPAAPDAPAA